MWNSIVYLPTNVLCLLMLTFTVPCTIFPVTELMHESIRAYEHVQEVYGITMHRVYAIAERIVCCEQYICEQQTRTLLTVLSVSQTVPSVSGDRSVHRSRKQVKYVAQDNSWSQVHCIVVSCIDHNCLYTL